MSFDPSTVALYGRHLIEASAGTGKTYNIANLFLRLLLEPHPSQVCGNPLTVDQILVVTFTNAATDELLGRIRKKLEEALQHFRGGDSSDAFICHYKSTRLTDTLTLSAACERLYNALLLVDDAAIFTIHSFASRAIQTFLFETGALADVELSVGGSDREEQQLDDIIRLLTLGPQKNLGQYLARQGIDSRRYMSDIRGLIKRSGISVLESKEKLGTLIANYEKEKKRLLEERESLARAWKVVDTRARDYNTVRDPVLQAIGGEISAANVTGCIKFCNDTFSSVKGYFDFGKTQRVVLDSPNVGKLSGLAGKMYAMVSNLAAFNANEDAISHAVTTCQSALLELLEQRQLPINLSQMQPDDVIQLINSKLSEPGTADILRQALTKQYPVCMVDEFQDTDPDQFCMFDRLYQQEDKLGLFAIGDPKQSIYAFRGADVFSYLDVKNSIKDENIHSLDINFRSKQGLVDAVNALFAEINDRPTFVYSGIEYEPVYSCENPPKERGIESQVHGIYRVGDREPESLVFIGNNLETSQTFNNLLPLYAADCAERVLVLLQGKQCATVEKNGKQEPVRAGDIAILVSDFNQAGIIKAALANKNLATVYLAQRDSVFQSCVFASDLLFILRAMDQPHNLHHLKAAFATPLMRHFQADTTLLDSLNTDSGVEAAIVQFITFCHCWQNKGVFSALYMLFEQYALHQAFAAQAECDRLMTDFRHLGDLLQHQYLLTGSRERLIDWYSSQLNNDSDVDEEAKSLRLESDENLIKIVTLHGCKGLEYPVVFIPFFFGFKDVDLLKNPPFYHRNTQQGEWEAVLDFQSNRETVQEAMRSERMAEDMRLLYVGITRAIYQCYIGISRSHYISAKTPLLPKTCWAHLLNLDDVSPDWEALKARLQQRMEKVSCAYETLSSASGEQYTPASDDTAADLEVQQPVFPSSYWQITSYSALAYQKDMRVVADNGQDELLTVDLFDGNALLSQETDDERWQQDIRYSLRGGTNTGGCLHSFFERMARGEILDEALAQELRVHGLARPEGKFSDDISAEKIQLQHQQAIAAWMQAVLSNPLGNTVPSLNTLFSSACTLPECSFDFSIGSNDNTAKLAAINKVLQSQCHASSGLFRKDRQEDINGVMTGSMDLLFIHDRKVYVLDYKSNILGKAPRFYDQGNLHRAMQGGRYDLQYLIYSVAAHRYMERRLGNRYAFDGGEYSFGGVFYLFLRGMGLPEYPDHGIYFTRPTRLQIMALDAAFNGVEATHHG